jgi:hypothetical protein
MAQCRQSQARNFRSHFKNLCDTLKTRKPSNKGDLMTNYGMLNITLGWITIVLGILSGSVIGLWSFAGPFKTPKGHHNYTDLPRRLNRLAHIACFMLPLISVVYGMHIDTLMISPELKMWGCYCWLCCMWGVPLFLFMASFYLPFKYLEVIPVSAGTFALFVMAYGNYLKLMSL